MQGVTQRVYSAWRVLQKLPIANVRTIKQSELEAIYHEQYWLAINGPALPTGVDNCLFDEAVNSGPSAAIKDLQKALGVRVDGVLGMVTISKLLEVNDTRALVVSICSARSSWLHRLSTWRFFGKGWSARIASVQADSLAMI